MCSPDGSLRLIAFTSFLIMMIDIIVLYQTTNQYNNLSWQAVPEVFDTCYEPQFFMRFVFTVYSINSALVCCLLSLAVSSQNDRWIERAVPQLLSFTYNSFGPLLLVFTVLGFVNIRSLMYECELNRVTEKLNLTDLFLLVICFAFATVITFLFAAQ